MVIQGWTEETVFVVSGRQTTAGLGPVSAVLNLETQKYYTLDGTALRIWELLSEPQTIRDLTVKLMERYDVDSVRCRDEVLVFLEELVANGLVETKRQPVSVDQATGIQES